MLTLVLFIGSINIALGFALAVYLERTAMPEREMVVGSPLPTTHENRPQAASVEGEEKTESDEADSHDETEPEEVPLESVEEELPLPVEEIPEEWLDLLDDSIKANSFVEATAQVLRLEVGHYREALVVIDTKLRGLAAEKSETTLDALLVEINELNNHWLDLQSKATNHLSLREGQMGDYALIGEMLDKCLLNQTTFIEMTMADLSGLDGESDPEGSCQQAIVDLGRLIDLAHDLKDRMHESLAVILSTEKRIHEASEDQLIDGITALPGRVGVEKMFDQWLADDRNASRAVSVALFNLDTFGQFNEKYGYRMGDRLLSKLARVLPDLIRKTRGMDQVARLDSNTFLLFYGDTGPRSALSVTERMRQTFAASTIEVPEGTWETTASIAVCELGDETALTFIERLRDSLAIAKEKGGNLSILDVGHGPEQAQSPSFQVSGHVISLIG